MSGDSDLPIGALTVTLHADGDQLRLAVTGDIDIATREAFERGVAEAIAKKPTTIVVDMAAVPFMDSTGIGVLVRGLTTFSADGGTFYLVNCRPPIRRALEITGVWALLTGEH